MATIFTHYYFQPWLLSNIIDNTTGKVPKYLHEFHVLERANIRIGVIGLAEKCVHSPHSRCALQTNLFFFAFQGMDRNCAVLAYKLRIPRDGRGGKITLITPS